ncbi:caspase, EACC1-associated type [Nocardia sp. NPDC055053]
MRLPDPAASRVVLLGSSTFRDPELTDLPAVRNNLTDLAEQLTSPDVTRLAREHVRVLPDEVDRGVIGDALAVAAAQADDMLLVYYSGHGLIGLDGALYLSLPNTRNDLVSMTGLPFAELREVLAMAPAKNRILILDCCFSGQAIGLMSSVSAAVAGQIDVAGTCTLTSSPANETSKAPEGARYTAYTGELLELLRRGPVDGSDLLTISKMHQELVKALLEKKLPMPQNRNTNSVGDLALAPRRVLSAPSPAGAPARVGTSEPVPTRSRTSKSNPPKRLTRAQRARKRARDEAAEAGQPPSKPRPIHPLHPSVPLTRRQALGGAVAVAVVAVGGAVAGWPDTADAPADSPLDAVPFGYELDMTLETFANNLAYSPDGHVLLTVAAREVYDQASFWDARTHERIGDPVPLDYQEALSIAFTPDGALFAIGNDSSGSVQLRSVSTREPVGEPLTGHNGSVNSVAFSRDGSFLATCDNTDVRLWNVATRRAEQTTILNDGPQFGMAFSPDGKLMAVGGERQVHLLNAHTGAPGGVLSAHINWWRHMAFSPDSSLLAAVEGDTHVQFWDLTTRAVVGAPLIHPDNVSSVAFRPDGLLLATGSYDRIVRLWNVSTRRLVAELRGAEMPVWSVSFSPDGTHLAAAGSAGRVPIWKAVSRP